jgi:hypothetical protein
MDSPLARSARVTRIALAVLALAVALPARAGVVLEFDEGDKRTTLELEGNKLRSSEVPPASGARPGARPAPPPRPADDADAPGEGDDGDEAAGPVTSRRERERTTIFDGDKQVFYTLDDAKKTYQRMDERSGAEMGKALEAQMEKMKAQLSPEQRKQLDEQLAKQKAQSSKEGQREAAWKFERAGGSQKVAGLTCDNYRVLRGGKLSSLACFAPWGAGGYGKDEFKAFQQMGKFMEKMARTMSESLGTGASQRSGDWSMQLIDTWPGIPAIMKDVEEDGTSRHEMRLVKIQRAPVPASRFAVPEGYRERPLMGSGE